MKIDFKLRAKWRAFDTIRIHGHKIKSIKENMDRID